ncbi:MAG: hypothetical protein Q7J80_09885 [Anaerolineales bacterium]|nr:hypothetical protein [Anaerolineales bacterium]
MTLDLTLAPLYRINGQEIASLPGLLVQTPPQGAARVRAQDRLVVYLLLTGNAVFSVSEYMQTAQNAADVFYKTSGSLTNALRAATENVNKNLLERNMTTSGRGQYTSGWLTLAALRDSQCTLSMSGPMHVFWFGQNETRHIHEPGTSGKGLGTSQNTYVYYSQISLMAGDRMLFFGKAPGAWESTLNDARPSSLEAMRRRLSTLTREDLNAVLIQSTEGTGVLNLLKGTAEIVEQKKAAQTTPPSLITNASAPRGTNLPRPEGAESTPQPFDKAQDVPLPARKDQPDSAAELPAHVLHPSAYAIPPQRDESIPQEPTQGDSLASPSTQVGTSVPRDFPGSIPRMPQTHTAPEPTVLEIEGNIEGEETSIPEKMEQPALAREPSKRTRQTAKSLAAGIRSTRRLSDSLGEKFRNFIPRLLPNSEAVAAPLPSSSLMIFMAILIPLMVVTIASVVYLRYGRSEQYDTYLRQAQQTRDQAASLSNPVEQRIAWENVLLNVEIAESHRETSDTISLRQEAENNLDALLGITHMQFNPAFSNKPGIDISRMTASQTDLYLLNAANGEALRAFPDAGGRGFQLDTTFNCKPGDYGNYTVGPFVDILALPGLNSINATLLGIDAGGNLLYCAPGLVAQPIPLPPPDTNWGRVTAFTLDGGNLYVLDSPARAVWVYNGKDGTFVDRPYFFFGQQTPTQDVIDFIVSGDELYMLHADGHLSNCSYSRIGSSSSQCQDPLPLINPFKAYQDIDLFATAHFTQLLFAAPPDQSILLLDADTQGVFRFSQRSLELQNQFRPTTGTANPIPSGSAGAVTISPNHVLYLAVDGQVYFATDMP